MSIWEPDDEMIKHIRKVKEQVKELAGTNKVLTEKRVEIGTHISLEESDCFGTVDLHWWSGTRLVIADLKYGMMPVDPKGNTQLLLYAVGVLGHLYPDRMVESVELM
ncbi:MAG: DUF2800 domain-containing protein, partial [Planctomycetes bacterium]|nr:DUF2800 domain-containing protein [Planctomycetota bacterium]